MKISLFITCLTDTYYPRVGRAVVAILEHLGHEVVFPAGQTCCGQPMFNTGYHEQAADLARRMIDVFEDADVVVTPSGSCAAMIHEYYPQLLHNDPAYAERARAFIHKTHEFVEFLTHVEKIDLRALRCKWPGHVTYHYSCHLRALGMTDETVRLIQQINGIQFTPLKKTEQCCGFGGTFAVKYPEISGAMVRDKTACIAETQAPTVICNDGGCAMNIAGALHREGSEVKLKHLAELIAEGLGLLEKE